MRKPVHRIDSIFGRIQPIIAPSEFNEWCKATEGFKLEADDVPESTSDDFVLIKSNKEEKEEKDDKIVEINDLGEKDTKKIKNILPKWKGEKGDKKKVNFHKLDQEPPLADRVDKIAFKPEKLTDIDEKDLVEEKVVLPLSIIRHSPIGNIAVSDRIQITFNQPMIPLSTVEGTQKINIPITISPQVEGEWKWLGTETLIYENEKHLPQSTNYQITVPKSFKSKVSGEGLEKDFTFKFSTPVPKLTSISPYRNAKDRALDQIISFTFNQAIHWDKVFPNVSVKANNKTYKLENVVEEEKKIDKYAVSRYNVYKVRATEAFPKDTSVNWSIRGEAKPIVGNKTVKLNESGSFKTYSPFKFKIHHVSTGHATITFNYSIDTDHFEPDMIKVKPAPKDLQITCNYASIQLNGSFKAASKVKVILTQQIKDTWGQNLKKETKVDLKFPDLSTEFSVFGQRQFGQFDTFMKKRKLFVRNVNIPDFIVKVHTVDSSHSAGYVQYVRAHSQWNYKSSRVVSRPALPGVLADTLKIKVDNYSKNTRFCQEIDFSKFLAKGRYGDLVLEFIPSKKHMVESYTKHYKEPMTFQMWVKASDIGIEFQRQYYSGLNANVIAKPFYLDSGLPVKDKNFEMAGDTKWDREGDHFVSKGFKNQHIIQGKLGEDHPWVKITGTTASPQKRVVIQQFSDRKLYKKSEDVCIKGLLRVMQPYNKHPQHPTSLIKLQLTVNDAGNNSLFKKEIAVDINGHFEVKFKLPEIIRYLGNCPCRLVGHYQNVRIESTSHIQVQEFRKPEFEASLKKSPASPDHHFYGKSADFEASASYLAGGSLEGAKISYNLTWSKASYSPPGLPGWSFNANGTGSTGRTTFNTGKIDEEGKHYLNLAFSDKHFGSDETVELKEASYKKSSEKPYKQPRVCAPKTVSLTSTVKDTNNQTQTASSSLIVHSGKYYVGLKAPKGYLEGGKNHKGQVIVADVDGKIVEDVQVEVYVFNRYNRYDKNQYLDLVRNEQNLIVNTTAKETGTEFEFETLVEGGTYWVYAKVADSEGRFNEASTTCHIYGTAIPASNIVNELPWEIVSSHNAITILPSKPTYKVDETAVYEVVTSVKSGHVVVSKCTPMGLKIIKEFDLGEQKSEKIEVLVKEEYIPYLSLKVSVTGITDRKTAKGFVDKKFPFKTCYSSSQITSQISKDTKTLTVAVTPEHKTVAPGSKTKVTIKVEDDKKNAVKDSLVTLAVVDESILALAGYSWHNPLDFFFASVQRHDSFSTVNNVTDVIQLAKKQDEKVELSDEESESSSDEEELEDVLEMDGSRAESMDLMSFGAAPRMASYSSAPRMLSKRSSSVQKFSMAPSRGRGAPKGKMKKKLRSGAQLERRSRAAPSIGGAAPGGVAKQKPIAIKVRKDFKSLAHFVSIVKTDKNGEVVVDFSVPDSLTRYRIMVIAENGSDRFGYNSSSVQARLPISIRPSPPRFLNFGDKFDLQVNVQNLGNKTIQATVYCRVTNLAFTNKDKQAFTITLSPEARARLLFPLRTKYPGTARFQIVALEKQEDGTLAFADAVEKDLPVYTPATTEAFATYGTAEPKDGKDKLVVHQKLNLPDNIIKEFGSLDLSFSSTQLGACADAAVYLLDYPYMCAEQISSAILAAILVRDTASAFSNPQMPSPSALKSYATRRVGKLIQYQGPRGGFGFWTYHRSKFYIQPYLTVHVGHCLARMKLKGYKTPDNLTRKLMPVIISFAKGETKYLDNRWHSWEITTVIQAYANYVLFLFGDSKISEARRILAGDVSKVSCEVLGWLLPTLSKAGDDKLIAKVLKVLGNRGIDTADQLRFTSSYSNGNYLLLHSSRRTDAVVLEGLLHLDEKKYKNWWLAIPKVIKSILVAQKKGRWSNTQECAMILVAIDHYFHKFEKVVPDFNLKAIMNGFVISDLTFKGRDKKEYLTNCPIEWIFDTTESKEEVSNQDIYLLQKGKGRFYYRLGLRYAPSDFKLEALNRGFVVERTYELSDKNEKGAKIVWKNDDNTKITVSQGAKVKITLTLFTKIRRNHVALVDRLPAGFETSFKDKAESSTGRRNRWSWCWWYNPRWYNHSNQRDDRTEIFADYLYAGKKTYTYTATATNPGIFVVPPLKASEMYAEENFGRSKSCIVEIV